MFSVWQNGPTRLKSNFLVHRFQTFTFGIGYTLKIGRVPPPKGWEKGWEKLNDYTTN